MFRFKYPSFLIALMSLCSFYSGASEVPEITPKALHSLDKKNYIIIDVRTPKEYLSGHVPGAINLPLSDIQQSEKQNTPGSLKLDNSKTLILYCRSGYRAGKAAKALKNMNFENLQHLKGDMLGWQKAGLPIDK